MDRLIDQVEKVLEDSLESSQEGYEILKSAKSLFTQAGAEKNKRRKTQLYNFSNVTEERKWVQVCFHYYVAHC